MRNKDNIKSEKIRTFYSYVLPSVLAFAISGVYTIVDGFFIGRKLGDIGLASIALDFYVAANMMYSDYFQPAFSSELYLNMARDFLNDKDAEKDKLLKYYFFVAK